ncbi:MAG: hypothetical protein R3D89_03025 [Sphingomonadaceae bacterium]
MFKRTGYWQHVQPTGMWADFKTVWQQAGGNRWRIALLSVLATGSLFTLMLPEGGSAPHAPPKVTYITVWPEHRTDEEIMASNIANQKFQEEKRAEQMRRDERVKDIYRALGKASGMDVEKIEAEAAAERAEEERAFQQQFGVREAQDAGE